jgi:hypothetical protein
MSEVEKETLKIGKGKPGPGRPKGVPNKSNAMLKDAILQAAQNAGGAEGIVGYLEAQATANPGPFMALLGKVLPTQHSGPDGEAIPLAIKVQFE